MSSYNRTNHKIDYQIHGEEMQCVEIELDQNETALAESGSFMMMDNGIQMQTIFGDGTGQDTGIFGKLKSVGKRLLTGESLFMTSFTNTTYGKKKVSFAAPYTGKIIALDLQELGGNTDWTNNIVQYRLSPHSTICLIPSAFTTVRFIKYWHIL